MQEGQLATSDGRVAGVEAESSERSPQDLQVLEFEESIPANSPSRASEEKENVGGASFWGLRCATTPATRSRFRCGELMRIKRLLAPSVCCMVGLTKGIGGWSITLCVRGVNQSELGRDNDG